MNIKKLTLLFLVASTMFTAASCNKSNVEKQERWKMTEFTSQSFDEDTVYTFDGGLAVVETYYDKHLENNFLCFTRWYGRDAMDKWFVNENGVLYECPQPTKYIKGSDGKMVKNPLYKKEYFVNNEKKSDFTWSKENEDLATLTYNRADGNTIYIFNRDRE